MTLMPLVIEAQSWMNEVGKRVKLPSVAKGLMVVDGELYCSVEGMLLRVKMKDGKLGSVLPDRVVVADEPKAEYVLKVPLTGAVYYTKKMPLFKVMRLHEQYRDNDGNLKSRVIKPGGSGSSVENPVFTSDGKYLIFASTGGSSMGGRDMFVSRKSADGWEEARNLGDSINTPGDEFPLTMWGDYLIFSSNGYDDTYGGADIYAVRMSEETKEKVDSVKVQLKYGSVQQLPMPINTAKNDHALAVMDDRVLVASEGDSVQMGDELRVYQTRLDYVRLKGVVRNEAGYGQPRAVVTVKEPDGSAYSVQTDKEGKYVLYLISNKAYEVVFGKVGYVNSYYKIKADRMCGDMICDYKYDVILTSFEPGSYFELSGVFGKDASVEIDKDGVKVLSNLIGFLAGNPHVQVDITMYCNQTSDKQINKLIAEKRAQAITEYVKEMVPTADHLTVVVGGDLPKDVENVKFNDLMAVKLGLF